MLQSTRNAAMVAAAATVALLPGCATERAVVSFDYVVTPKRSLPEGMKTLAIMPAELCRSMKDATEKEW